MLGDDADAEAALHQAVTLDPDYAPAWLSLGHVYMARSRTREAAQAYRAAMAADPTDPVAPFNPGRLEEEAGNGMKAWEYYSESLARDPAFGPVRERLGLQSPGAPETERGAS